MILILVLFWIVYITIGAFWLNHLINQSDDVENFNMVGSLILVTLWPFGIIWTVLRKFKK